MYISILFYYYLIVSMQSCKISEKGSELAIEIYLSIFTLIRIPNRVINTKQNSMSLIKIVLNVL